MKSTLVHSDSRSHVTQSYFGRNNFESFFPNGNKTEKTFFNAQKPSVIPPSQQLMRNDKALSEEREHFPSFFISDNSVPKIQRSCGRNEISNSTECDNSHESVSGDRYLYNVNCDEPKPGERLRMIYKARDIENGDHVDIHGFASEDGPTSFNYDLSCARAIDAKNTITSELNPRGISANINTYAHGELPGERTSMRSVIIHLPKPNSQINKKQSKNQAKKHCSGFPPSISNCSVYGRNKDWLPDAYVKNATCACLWTPNEPHANCIRKELQDRLNATTSSFKKRAKYEKAFGNSVGVTDPLFVLLYGRYKKFVVDEITPRVYRDHVAAYRKAGCNSGPAPYPAWIGVTSVPMPSCDLVWKSILYGGGSCSGKIGQWL